MTPASHKPALPRKRICSSKCETHNHVCGQYQGVRTYKTHTWLAWWPAPCRSHALRQHSRHHAQRRRKADSHAVEGPYQEPLPTPPLRSGPSTFYQRHIPDSEQPRVSMGRCPLTSELQWNEQHWQSSPPERDQQIVHEYQCPKVTAGGILVG